MTKPNNNGAENENTPPNTNENPEKNFSESYVKELREEAKTNRIKNQELEGTIEKMKKDSHREVSLVKIEKELDKMGVKIAPEKIFKEGETVEKMLQDYQKENPDLFKTETLNIAGMNFDGHKGNVADLQKPMSEIKKVPAARKIVSNVYQRLLNREKVTHG